MLNTIAQLDKRRKDLGMSCAMLAKRSGVSMRTVQRVLAGAEDAANFSTIVRLAKALGGSLQLDFADLNQVRHAAAERKADRLVSMVQGTMALEAQAVESATIRQMKRRTVRELLSGSSRKLWED